MTDWEITETTSYCDALGTNVTLTIRHDGSLKCTGNRKYVENPTKKRMKEVQSRGRRIGREFRCEGLGCSKLLQYQSRLIHEQ